MSMRCNKCNNLIEDNVSFCPHCGAPVQPEGKRKGTGLAVLAAVFAVVAACFLGIALYIFIQPETGPGSSTAGKTSDAEADIATQTAGQDVAAGGENDAGQEETQIAADDGGAETDGTSGGNGQEAVGNADGASPSGEEDLPKVPILQVENVHTEGANGGCTMDYSRVSLGGGTETVFPELTASLNSYSNEKIAGVEEMYNTLLPVAGETNRWLSVSMSLSLARADENVLSLHYDYSDYSGGAHGYYWDGGATFDTKTGARLKLSDICTDMGELARIVAATLYAEGAERFSVSEAEMAQNIAANEVSPENQDSWFCEPEGLHVFFPPYSISYYAAGQPDVVVRYVDHPNIFNERYVSMQNTYVTYDPPEESYDRFDYDNDGSMNSIHIYRKYLQGEGASTTYQNFTIYLNEAEVCEQQTAEYHTAHTYRIKSDGRSLYVIETENVDGTNTSYIYDITNGSPMLTGSVNGGVYVRSMNEAGQSVILQSSQTDRILFGGDAVTRWKVTAEGSLEAK